VKPAKAIERKTMSPEKFDAEQPDPEEDLIRLVERERLRALVSADLETADRLHAHDFQLITPVGRALSKAEYLGAIDSGDLNYLVWEPDSAIQVRVSGEAAVIRYTSRLENEAGGHKNPLRRHWHTDSYEKREGRWQVVWSHATAIQNP